MLELHLDKKEAVESVVAVRWCVTKDTLDLLKEKKILDPQILLVVIKDGKDVLRKVASIDQLMEYSEFNSPGKQKIAAAIVGCCDGNSAKLKKELLAKTGYNKYENNIINEKGILCPEWYCRYENIVKTEIVTETEINVAAEFFAKEPWDKKWVNLFFDYPAQDPCQNRKRRFWAYPVQPFFVLINLLLRFLVTTFFALCGMRGLRYKAVFNIFEYDFASAWRNRGYSIFTKNAKREDRIFIFPLLAPIFWLTVFFLTWGLSLLKNFQWSFWFISGLTLLSIPAAALVILLICLLDEIPDWCRSLLGRWGLRRFEKRLARIRTKTFTENEALICAGSQMDANINALPKEKRTIYLRFKAVKAKFCKPYAKE